MGYCLKQLGVTFTLVDSHNRVGDAWCNRYDSLTLFTPRRYSALPGKAVPGDPDGYPTKDEIADYLEDYAAAFDIPVLQKTVVQKVRLTDVGFQVETSNGILHATQVIVATGPFQKPYVPTLPGQVDDDLYQVHTSSYLNPQQLKKGPVLVAGAGNSGVQIAAEVSAHHDVFLSVGKPIKMLPQKLLNRSIFWWYDVLRISKVTANSKLGQMMQRNEPIIGTEIKPYLQRGRVLLRQRTVAVSGKTFTFENGETCTVENVIWATGFRSDYSWLDVPGVVSRDGRIQHQRGITSVRGLYFLGLPWQYTRGSALIGGVGQDAQYLAREIRKGLVSKA